MIKLKIDGRVIFRKILRSPAGRSSAQFAPDRPFWILPSDLRDDERLEYRSLVRDRNILADSKQSATDFRPRLRLFPALCDRVQEAGAREAGPLLERDPVVIANAGTR